MTAFPTSCAVLGSTGSVGQQALSVARALGCRVDLLAAGSSVSLLEEQAREFLPRMCAVSDPAAARELSLRLADTPVRVLSGEEGLLTAIGESDADVFVNAILGKAGLMPSLAVCRTGKRLALSNKESMVIAGPHVRAAAAESGTEILPVDSEHSAIFQCLLAGQGREVRRLLLTASGGPFYGYDRARLAAVKLSDTLAHPTWKMGAKITVDSATLMNKGFEVIEAVRLFDVPPDAVEVLVHPESIIHSAVEYIDNTVMAELSVPDMRACVQYAMTYPDRRPACIPPLDLFALGKLTFHRPDPEAFPALSLAFSALRMGGAAPAVLNAADEVAVAAFLQEEISFLDIADVLEGTLSRVPAAAAALSEILAADAEARAVARNLIDSKRKGAL